MATWLLTAGAASTANGTAELTRATSRRFTWRLDGRHDAAFTIDGRSQEATALIEMTSDLWVRRDGVLLFRGRCVPSTDDVSADRHATQMTALAYMSVLDYRHMYEGDAALAHTTVDQAQIAWLLLNASQARTGGALGITQGTNGFTAGAGSTGITRTRNYVPGDSVGKLITDLSQCLNGFDVDIDPTLKIQVYYPSRGAAGARLSYGGNVTSVRRTFIAGHFANTTHLTGNGALVAEDRVTAGLGSDARGRWEAWVADPNIARQATLSERATAVHTALSRPSYGYSCTMRAGAWRGSGDVWIGDTVTLAVKSGRIATVASCRVRDLTVTLSGNADEVVSVTLEDLT